MFVFFCCMCVLLVGYTRPGVYVSLSLVMFLVGLFIHSLCDLSKMSGQACNSSTFTNTRSIAWSLTRIYVFIIMIFIIISYTEKHFIHRCICTQAPGRLLAPCLARTEAVKVMSRAKMHMSVCARTETDLLVAQLKNRCHPSALEKGLSNYHNGPPNTSSPWYWPIMVCLCSLTWFWKHEADELCDIES